MQKGVRRHRPHALTTALSLAWALACPRPAAAQDVPAARQVLILSRALSYDGNLKQRAGGDLLIAVVGRNGAPASDSIAAAMSEAFQALANVKVQGMPLRSIRIGYSTPAALESAIVAQGIDVLYICPGLEAELAVITGLCRKKRLLSFGSRVEHVERGLSLGVFTVEGRPTIVVNLAAAREEGAAFASDLLRLARVVR